MFRSAIFKLTAFYLIIVMVISILFSIVVYQVAIHELRSGLQNQYTRWYNAYEPFGLRQPSNPSTELALRSHDILMELTYLNLLVLCITGYLSFILARRSLRPIERAHIQQKRFTADVSHELRTPLTTLIMETEIALLDSSAPATALRGTLTSNLEEATRMKLLVNTLLQLTSLEAEEVQTTFTPVSTKDIVHAAVQAEQVNATTHHITVRADIPEKLVFGDTASLTQLCIILLENAIRYSPVGSTVNITSSSSTNHVLIRIIDTGAGIAADDLPHVFDRFYRASAARESGEGSGLGLGLSLAKLIADVHNAEIIMLSSPGKGTTATIKLPKRAKKRSTQ